MTISWGRRATGSARARILVGVISLLALGAVMSNVAVRAVLYRESEERIHASLVQEVAEFRRLAASGRDPRTGDDLGDDLRGLFDLYLQTNVPGSGETFLTFVEGEPYLVSSDRARRRAQANDLRDLGGIRKTTFAERPTRIGPMQLVAVPVSTHSGRRGTFVVTEDVGQDEAEIREATHVAAGVSISVLLLGSALAFLLVGRILAPLRSLSDTATSITESDLSRRIDVAGRDEIAQLGHTFNAMLDRIEAGFQTQRNFISDAGHELRTPITIIRGHLELMSQDPEGQAATLEIVVDELDRMARFVDDLLLLARAEHGAPFLFMEELDVDELTAMLVDKARGLGDRAWTTDAFAACALRADGQRLTQAVMNLARNAVEHSAPGDVIGIGSSEADGEVRLWVRDTGPGVPVADRERIFDRFTRGTSGPRRSDGAGLGLAIARVIAEAHGGRVELRSVCGEGSTFSIIVPTGRGAEDDVPDEALITGLT